MLRIVVLRLLEVGPGGWSALGMLGLSLLLALAMLVVAAIPSGEAAARWLRGLGMAAAGCFVTGLAAASALVAASWRPLFSADSLNAQRPALSVSDQFDLVEQAGTGLFAAAVAALPFALFLGLAAALWAIHPARGPRGTAILRALLRVTVALLAVAAAFALVAYAWNAPSLLVTCHSSDDVECMAREWLRGGELLAQARIGVIAIAVLGGALFTIAALRTRRTAGSEGLERRDTVTAALLFVVGLASWISTRDLSQDARHPLSPRSRREEGCPVWNFEAPRLPPAVRCVSRDNILWIEMRPGHITVNGEPSTLADLKADLQDKSRIFSKRPRDPVLIAAEADLSYAVAQPVLSVIQGVWDPTIDILVVRSSQIERTATLGDVPRRARCCATPVRLDAPGIPPVNTWGELAATAAAQVP